LTNSCHDGCDVLLTVLFAGPVVFLDFMRAPVLKAFAEVRNDQVSHMSHVKAVKNANSCAHSRI
jgi:hypothetical protein